MQVKFSYNKYCYYKNHLSILVICTVLPIGHLFVAIVVITKLSIIKINRNLTAVWVKHNLAYDNRFSLYLSGSTRRRKCM